jgi:hypothetical protein
MKTIIKTCLSFVIVVFPCFGPSPVARAVVPPPDGGYPNFTTAEGQNALQNLTTGAGNTAVGWFSLFADTTGSFNTAVGAGALALNTAHQNTATGAAALLLNTTGDQNTANGALALLNNTTGRFNTALGNSALAANIDGSNNTAVGNRALLNNTTGNFNTAVGDIALLNNTGNENTATGSGVLVSNTTGVENTAIGSRALESNTIGNRNTAIGRIALASNTTGELNTAIGYQALSSNTGGSNNVAVGLFAGGNVITANNVICIGPGVTGADVSNSCYIGNIWNQTGGSQAVYVNSEGKLGAQVSSRRFKDEIKPLEEVSEVIYRLEPVSFRYKLEIEPTRPLGFGLIAEDVAKISPDLVTRGSDGQVNSVRYDAVNAMLLNEFLKEHKNVQQLKATLAQQQKEIAALIAHIKEQDAKIQSFSDQLEMSKAALQVASTK